MNNLCSADMYTLYTSSFLNYRSSTSSMAGVALGLVTHTILTHKGEIEDYLFADRYS